MTVTIDRAMSMAWLHPQHQMDFQVAIEGGLYMERRDDEVIMSFERLYRISEAVVGGGMTFWVRGDMAWVCGRARVGIFWLSMGYRPACS